jgi:predicted acetyltransferase
MKKNDLVIRKLTLDDEEVFFDACDEFEGEENFAFVPHLEDDMEFAELVELLKDQVVGKNLPEGFVPSTYLFGFVQRKLVGRTMVRHTLNDFLERIGGHIGYGVVSSERGKGYATELLKESLMLARSLGLKRVLLTCDEDNLASKKIIENAGGIFENISNAKEGHPKKRRYWIDIL